MVFSRDKYPLVSCIRILVCLTLLCCSIPSCTDRKKETIRIGFVGTLSGRLSDSGIKARNGIELAVAQANASGGILQKEVQLMVKDNLDDEKTNAAVIKELIDDGAVAILGPLKSSMAKSSLEAIRDRNVLMISPTISTDAVNDLDDNFLRIMPVVTRQAITVAEKIIHDGHRNVSIVYDASNLAYTEPLYLKFREFFEKKGNRIITVSALTDKTARGFHQVAQTISRVGPDALFIITSGIDAAFLCQQIYKTKLSISIYGSYWVKSGNLIEEGGKSVEGIVIITPYSRPEPSRAYISFKHAYTKEYGIEPKYLAIYAYDAIQLLFNGLRLSGTAKNTASIKQSIIDQEKFRGLEDDFKINRYGDAVRKDMFVSVKDGKFIRIAND